MFKIDGSIFLQNINMLARQLFLLFKKSTTFWDNPRSILVLKISHYISVPYLESGLCKVGKVQFHS